MRLTPEVEKFLRDQVDEMQLALSGLKSTIAGLQKDEQLMADELAAAIKLLGPSNQPPPFQASKGNGEDTNEPKLDSGIRDAIKAVLAEAARPMRPRDVAVELERRGFQSGNAKTNLSVRVANELWRMGRAGSVSKRGKLYRTEHPQQ